MEVKMSRTQHNDESGEDSDPQGLEAGDKVRLIGWARWHRI